MIEMYHHLAILIILLFSKNGAASESSPYPWEEGIVKVHKNGREMCFDAAHIPIGFESTEKDHKVFKSFTTPFSVTGNEIVTVYGGLDCAGTSLSFPISYEESRCNYCWDSCYSAFDDGTPAHTNLKSIRIPEGVVALSYNTCLGSFGYSDPGFLDVLEPGCHDISTNFASHFAFAEESSTTPGKYELLGNKGDTNNGIFESEMSSEHWLYGPNGISNAQGGSWYQYIFELLDPTEPRMRFQVGNGGTWYVSASTCMYEFFFLTLHYFLEIIKTNMCAGFFCDWGQVISYAAQMATWGSLSLRS